MAMARTAHQFSVLLPVPPRRGAADPVEQRRRLELARRIIDWEKPAHTVFDVKFYWALFRVGEVRLGVDTLLDLGGRAPELLTPMVVGQGFLAESYLGSGPPCCADSAGRIVPGRDRLGLGVGG